MPEIFKLMTVEQAKDIFAAHLPATAKKVKTVPTTRALGRVLAEDVVSGVDVPGFDRSTMDGFAVRARDTFGASEGMPAYLTVAGEILMGQAALEEIAAGQAVKIATGGMLPPGADAVVMVEYTEDMGGGDIAVVRPVAPGENVVRRGEDVREGQVLLPAGMRLRPQELGALAGIGVTGCPVVDQPRVAIISTGDELVPPEEVPATGQVRDVNSYALKALVEDAGGEGVLYGIVQDDFDTLKSVVDQALTRDDIVVISGGSSVGTRDVTAAVLNSFGAPGVLVHGVAVKPGKPTILAVVRGKPVFGLPGHPVSAMVLSDLFLVPAVRHLLGIRAGDKKRPVLTARLSRSLASASGRVDYVRVALAERDGELWAEPVLGKSGLISTMVKADGFVVIAAVKEGLAAGEPVEVIFF